MKDYIEVSSRPLTPEEEEQLRKRGYESQRQAFIDQVLIHQGGLLLQWGGYEGASVAIAVRLWEAREAERKARGGGE